MCFLYISREQLHKAEERARLAEENAAEERGKAQAMMMKAVEAAAAIGEGRGASLTLA